VIEVQVVVQVVFVIIATVDCDNCWSPSADDNDVVPGGLTAEVDAVLGTLEVTGTMPLTISSSSEEVGKMLAVCKELIEVEEMKQLVSVTVVLSVTVTTETC
jgi:hypothetical protein